MIRGVVGPPMHGYRQGNSGGVIPIGITAPKVGAQGMPQVSNVAVE